MDDHRWAMGVPCGGAGFTDRRSGARVTRLIDPELATARQGNTREPSPSLVLHRFARRAVSRHFQDERFYVVAHQVELVQVVAVGRMDRHFALIPDSAKALARLM